MRNYVLSQLTDEQIRQAWRAAQQEYQHEYDTAEAAIRKNQTEQTAELANALM